ncbi:MAG TPA: hypothetical protein VH413_13195 [Verrucomicrobiae bacterium]|jgi:hypothetical protein|nr:hypothetical protein [Verrucomicrobiae bacterium]
MNTHLDARALKILCDSYWSPQGWKPQPLWVVSPEDFKYAKSKGVMFESGTRDHQKLVEDLSSTIKQLTRRRVVDAFLASLSTRRLEWRSALGSYAVFQHLPIHEPVKHDKRCGLCGLYLNEREQDLNILNFERLKWGGVRHNDVIYAAFDLNLFLAINVAVPTPEDIQIFRNLINSIVAAPPKVTSATLHSHFKKVIKSNKAERDIIISILGFCGILETSEHRGFSDEFIAVSQQKLPDRRFVDMHYPACWWNAIDGVNQKNLKDYFGHVL